VRTGAMSELCGDTQSIWRTCRLRSLSFARWF
jgi:hypothetical protein